jgi:hypothetical protein
MKKLAARIIINDLIKYAEPVFELCKANTVNIGLKKIEILAMKTLLEELDNRISKDKIKEKIIELEKSELMGRYYYEQIKIATDILKELLDDTNNLEIANIKYSTAESQRNTMRELLKGE